MDFDFSDDLTALSSGGSGGQSSERTSSEWPQAPHEDNFVSTRASVRCEAYQLLETWLTAGGPAQSYVPWFQELLMDTDGRAFIAATRAVAAHYASGGATQQLIRPSMWLGSLAERLQLSAEEDEMWAAAVLLQRASAGPWDFQAELRDFFGSPGLLWLLLAAVKGGALLGEQVAALLDEMPKLHDGPGKGRSRSAMAALKLALPPALQEAVPQHFQHLLAPEGSPGSNMPSPSKASPQMPRGGPKTRADEVLGLLGDRQVKSWKERLSVLENLQEGDLEEFPGTILWPHLVLQSEDDHPAVSAAAFHAVGRLAARLGDPGDLMTGRLAGAVSSKLREGRPRGIDAAAACVLSMASSGVLRTGSLCSFISQALGCSPSRARAAVTSGPNVQALLQEALPQRRARTSGPSTPTPGKKRSPAPQVSPQRPTVCPPQPPVLFTPAAQVTTQQVSAPQPTLLFTTADSTPQQVSPSHPLVLFSPEGEPAPRAFRYAPAVPAASVTCSFTHLPPASVSSASTRVEEEPSEEEEEYTTTPPHRGWSNVSKRSSTPEPCPTRRVDLGHRTLASASSCFLGPQLAADSRLLSPSYVLQSPSPMRVKPGWKLMKELAPPLPEEPRSCKLLQLLQEGVRALEIGGGPNPWHAALRHLAAWDPAAADGPEVGEVVELLRAAASRLPIASRPELWRALSDLQGALWLPEGLVLELALGAAGPAAFGGCLAFTEPSVVAAFLSTQVLEEKLSAGSCVNFCLQRLLRGGHGDRVAQVLLTLLESLRGSRPSLLGEMELPALPAAVSWALGGRGARSALPTFRSSAEILLQYLSPKSVTEQCLTQMCTLLGRPCPGSAHGSNRGASGLAVTSPALLDLDSVTDDDVALQPRSLQGASPGERSELATTLLHLHRLLGDLARLQAGDLPSALNSATQLLLRPQCWQPIRSFLQRLILRQKLRAITSKENWPLGHAKPAAGPDSAGEFLSDDYATVRELAADEGLAGAFPHSVLGHLKHLLKAPAAASTHRAAVDCLVAVAVASGPVLLRVLLRHFSGALLRLAASRGPMQQLARAALVQFTLLEDGPFGPSEVPKLRWLRHVWRALMQCASRTGGESSLLQELLRWLAEDVLVLPDASLSWAEIKEVLAAIAPALEGRCTALRSVAGRALLALATFAGGVEKLREDLLGVHAFPGLTAPQQAALLMALDRADSVSPLDLSAGCALPSLPPRSRPVTAKSQPVREAPQPSVLASRSSRAPLRSRSPTPKQGAAVTASEEPCRLQLSPQKEEPQTPEEEADVPSLPGPEQAKGPSGSEVGTPRDATALLGLCAARTQEASKLADPEDAAAALDAALEVLLEDPVAFLPAALQLLTAKSAAAAFTSVLRALTQLQLLSSSTSPRLRQACAAVLLELPRKLAAFVDGTAAPLQLTAWLQVAADVLGYGVSSGWPRDSSDMMGRWALRFCTRCFERCVSEIWGSARRTDLPIWEVLAAFVAANEQLLACTQGDGFGRCARSSEWHADLSAWCRTLQEAALLAHQDNPAEVHDFLLLASSTGRQLPEALEKLKPVA